MLVVEVGANCLCVPAFSAGGYELQQTLDAFQKSGVFPHECSVEIDNAKRVTFFDGTHGHVAVWVVGKRQILSKSFVAKCKLTGQMDDVGTLEVVESVLRWNRVKPDNLPPKQVKAVEALHAVLRRRLYPPQPPT